MGLHGGGCLYELQKGWQIILEGNVRITLACAATWIKTVISQLRNVRYRAFIACEHALDLRQNSFEVLIWLIIDKRFKTR